MHRPPLSEIHLENMLYLARVGAVIFPPTVAYYSRPASVEDVTDQVVGRVIDQLGIEHPMTSRWKEPRPTVEDGDDQRLLEVDGWTAQPEPRRVG
ncbi:hypothetical protein EB74_02425 [Mycobacterium sp. SWH-M5]|nr:hypothetical protein EB74_02425 [Mycobacterium sp. SWH-M5]